MISKFYKLPDNSVLSLELNCENWVADNIQYSTLMGSNAYGVANENSDIDIYGFTVPPREVVFPVGDIPGFGMNKAKRFDQYQQSFPNTKPITDISIYSIVRYFQLCMENNPNMIDSLFTYTDDQLFFTKVGAHVKQNRRLFLHKGSYVKFGSYAMSQLNKLKNKHPEGKRVQIVEEFGYDVKFAYHCIRLLDEAYQILRFYDIDLKRNAAELISIRKGEVPRDDIIRIGEQRYKELEYTYENSTLPKYPNELVIKNLLIECLEESYGSLRGIF